MNKFKYIVLLFIGIAACSNPAFSPLNNQVGQPLTGTHEIGCDTLTNETVWVEIINSQTCNCLIQVGSEFEERECENVVPGKCADKNIYTEELCFHGYFYWYDNTTPSNGACGLVSANYGLNPNETTWISFENSCDNYDAFAGHTNTATNLNGYFDDMNQYLTDNTDSEWVWGLNVPDKCWRYFSTIAKEQCYGTWRLEYRGNEVIVDPRIQYKKCKLTKKVCQYKQGETIIFEEFYFDSAGNLITDLPQFIIDCTGWDAVVVNKIYPDNQSLIDCLDPDCEQRGITPSDVTCETELFDLCKGEDGSGDALVGEYIVCRSSSGVETATFLVWEADTYGIGDPTTWVQYTGEFANCDGSDFEEPNTPLGCTDVEILNNFCAYSVKGERLFQVQKHKCFIDGIYQGAEYYDQVQDTLINPDDFVIQANCDSDCLLRVQEFCDDTDCDGASDVQFISELRICTDGSGEETREVNYFTVNSYGTTNEVSYEPIGKIFPCEDLDTPCETVCMTCTNFEIIKPVPVKGTIKLIKLTAVKTKTLTRFKALIEECEPEGLKCKRGDKLELVICGETITEAYYNDEPYDLPIDTTNFERIEDCDAEISTNDCDYSFLQNEICISKDGAECSAYELITFCDAEAIDTITYNVDSTIVDFKKFDCAKCIQVIGCFDARFAQITEIKDVNGFVIPFDYPLTGANITTEFSNYGATYSHQATVDGVTNYFCPESTNVGESTIIGFPYQIGSIESNVEGLNQFKSFGDCSFTTPNSGPYQYCYEGDPVTYCTIGKTTSFYHNDTLLVNPTFHDCTCPPESMGLNYEVEFKASGIQQIVTDCGTWNGNYNFTAPLAPPQSSDDAGSQMQQAKIAIDSWLAANGGGTVRLEYVSVSILKITITGSSCVAISANDDSNPGPHNFTQI